MQPTKPAEVAGRGRLCVENNVDHLSEFKTCILTSCLWVVSSLEKRLALVSWPAKPSHCARTSHIPLFPGAASPSVAEPQPSRPPPLAQLISRP